jgi:hypothetical protein
MTRDQEFGWRALGEYIPLIDTLLDRKISSNQQIWDKMEDRRAALSGGDQTGGSSNPSGSWQNVMVEGVPKRGEDVLRRRYVEDDTPETTGPMPRGLPMARFPSIWELGGEAKWKNPNESQSLGFDPNAYFGEDSDYDALGFDRWLLEKYQNSNDFSKKLRANAERLNVPLGIPQGSPAERSLDKSMLTGGAGTIYDILKYLKQLAD